MDPRVRVLLERGLGDTRLESIAWRNDGGDLALALRPPQTSGEALEIRLVWVAKLRISIDFGVYAGAPLIFGSMLTPIEGGGWALEIDFGAAPEGRLSCECNEIVLERGSL
jgi:hypothetical protein